MRKVLLTTACTLVAAGVANADVLYDQSAYDPLQTANVNQEFDDFPTYSSYLVDDVSFASPVTVNSVSVWFTNQNGLWGPAITSARLHIFAKSGSLPLTGDDPSASPIVGITFAANPDGWTITAGGLSENLAAGDYWIGITPIAGFGAFSQEFQRYTSAGTLVGDVAAFRNPGGAFGFGTDWSPVNGPLGGPGDANLAMLVEGVIIPGPGALALLGLAGLAGSRRRRA